MAIQRIDFDDAIEKRYIYYDTNLDCVYVGHETRPPLRVGNDWVAFNRKEWERIAAFFQKLG